MPTCLKSRNQTLRNTNEPCVPSNKYIERSSFCNGQVLHIRYIQEEEAISIIVINLVSSIEAQVVAFHLPVVK